MVIVMEHVATEDQVQKVIEALTAGGYDVHRSSGVNYTLLGAVGAPKERLDPAVLELLPGVREVVRVSEPYKLAGRAFRPTDTLVDIAGIVVGGPEVMIAAGPCSVESAEQILTVARAVRASGAKLLRGGAFKPRSSPYAFQGHGEEALKWMRAAADETSLAIGALVARRVPDGATMQMGIGAVPDAVLHGLLGRHAIKVWSEMFSDGILALEAAGATDQEKPLTASFLFGSEELYRWVDRNPRVRMLRTETTNEPALIARNHAMVSVNTALQVDLFAQANASRIRARIHSGFGGQTDFIVGALHSQGGQALMALRSWHPKADVSTIIPLVDEPVTSFQFSAVITEQGVAPIYGYDEKTQAANLINNAAHPKVRGELWEEAAELGLL